MISHDILRVYMILWMRIYDTRNEYIYIYIIKDNRILKYEDRNILIYICSMGIYCNRQPIIFGCV